MRLLLLASNACSRVRRAGSWSRPSQVGHSAGGVVSGLLVAAVAWGWSLVGRVDAQEPTSAADVIVVVGAAGEPEFGEAFSEWADSWEEAARRSGTDLVRFGDDPASESGSADDSTDRERLRLALAGLDPDNPEPIWLVLIGHGTFSQNVAKFNLRGPDVSAGELAGWVSPIRRPLVVIATFSASGPFINALSGENRVIVTATQSGIEQNYSRLGKYLAAAMLDPASDIDHDGEVSVLEAFLAGAAGVRDFYQSSGRLLTENALLDDNGDGLGTPATAFRGTRPVLRSGDPGRSLDGSLAAKITLAPAVAKLPFTAEELSRRAELEAELERWHVRRGELAQAEYEEAVLPNLLALAKLYRAAEQRLADQTPVSEEPDLDQAGSDGSEPETPNSQPPP